MPIAAFLELICFTNVKNIILGIMKLVHQVGGFVVSKSDDEIGYLDFRAIE